MPFGIITRPGALSSFDPVDTGGLGQLLQLFLNVLIVAGSIYALFNFVLAGYAFMSAGDDPKKIAGAWAKIWQTALGLTIVAGSFVLAGIFGYLIFKDTSALLTPSIIGP